MCNGYDSRAVKVPKSVKALAACYKDKHQRGAFIRSYVKIYEDEARQKGSRNRKDKA